MTLVRCIKDYNVRDYTTHTNIALKDKTYKYELSESGVILLFGEGDVKIKVSLYTLQTHFIDVSEHRDNLINDILN